MTVVRIHSKKLKRGEKVQAIQHMMPSFLLLQAGLESFHHIPLLGIFEFLAGGLMLIVAISELRPKHHHESPAVRYADLFAAAMLLGEGMNRAHEGGHYLPYFYAGLSVLMAIRAYTWKFLTDRRVFKIDDDGFMMRRRFKSIQIPWQEVKSLKTFDDRIEVETNQGRRTIELIDIENRSEIIEALQKNPNREFSGSYGTLPGNRL